MEHGGVVPDLELPSDSLQTSLVSPLLSEEESTASDTLGTEGYVGIDFDSLDPLVVERAGVENFTQNIPTNNLGLPNRPLPQEEWMANNPKPNVPSPMYIPSLLTGEKTLTRPSQEQYDNYNADVQAYNDSTKEYSDSIDEYNEKIESARLKFKEFDVEVTPALTKILRTATAESIEETFNNAKEGEKLDLSRLKTNDQGLEFKPRDMEATKYARFQLEDFWNGKTEDFVSMIDEITTSEAEILSQEIKGKIENLEREIKNLGSPQKTSFAVVPSPYAPRADSEERLKLNNALQEQKSYLDSQGGVSEIFVEDYRATQARIWIEKYVKENVALSEEEWNNSRRLPESGSSIGLEPWEASLGWLGTYNDYLGELEVQIHEDLMFSKESYDFTQVLGMDGMKLWLEGGIELDERNTRWKDAELSWRVGVNEMAKTIAATATAMERDIEFIGGGLPEARISRFRFTMPDEDDTAAAREALYKFDEERNARIFELRNRQTQFAVTQKQIEQFGISALSNEMNAAEEYAGIFNDAKYNLAFKEGPLRAIESMPLSLSAMGVGLVTATMTGGGSLVASLTTGGLIGLGVSSRTFYDSYSNPIFYTQEDGTIDWDKPNITETERHGMATMQGIAEGTGEFIGMMTMMGIGKFVKAGGISPWNVFKKAPKVKTRYRTTGSQVRPQKYTTTIGASKYSSARKLLDYGFGLVYGSGFGALEEYVAEGFTGVTSMFIDSYYSGKKYTQAQYIERFHEDGYIGAWAGAAMGGGAVSASTFKAQYERIFRPETFNAKAAASYYHQLTNSGFFMNGADKATRKELNDLLQVMAKETAKGGQFTNLTGEQQETVKKINELISDLDYSKNRNIKTLEQLAADGRYDLLAEMVMMDNQMLFFEAMSVEFSKTDDGLWMNEKGYLVADPTNLNMFDMNTKLSEEQRKGYRDNLIALKLRMNTFYKIANKNLHESPDYVAPERKTKVSDWRAKSNENDYTEIVSEKDGKLDDQAPTKGIEGKLAGWASAAKGRAKVIIHKTKESLRAATGKSGLDNALYMEASPEQKSKGIVDEMHVFIGDANNKVSESEIMSDMTHEFGHWAFEDILKDDATREKIADEIFTLAKDNEDLSLLVKAVKQTYPDYDKGSLEREIINKFMEAVARGGFKLKDEFVEFNLSNNIMGFQNWGMNKLGKLNPINGAVELGNADSAIKLAIKYSNFVKGQGLSKLEATEATEQQQATEKQEVEETAEQQEAAALALKLSGLDDALQANRSLNMSDLNAEGPTTIFYKAEIENESLPRVYMTEVNDYNHFKNLYSYKTGNGDASNRMRDAYYMKGGKQVFLEAPETVLDRRTGEKRNVNIPYVESYSKYAGQQRLQESDLTSELSNQWADLTKEVSQLYGSSDKKLNLYTQESDFTPSNMNDFDSVEGLMNGIESLVIKRENIQALIDSDITKEELKELAGDRGLYIDKATNPEIYNMSGRLAPESFGQRSERLNNEIQEYGAPWQLLPKDSPSYENRISDLRLATQEELEYAAEKMERLKAGEPLEGHQLGFDAGLASRELEGLANRGLREIEGALPENWNIEENYVRWLIDSGYKLDDVVIDKYNYDRQRVGWIEIEIPKEGGGTYTFKYYNSGGVWGGQALKDSKVLDENGREVNIVTSHSGDSTAEAAMNSMIKADNTGKVHVSLFQVLKKNNSLNAPKQMAEVMNYISKYIEHNPSHIPAIIEAFNKKFDTNAGSGVVGGRLGKFLDISYTSRGSQGLTKGMENISTSKKGREGFPSIKITSKEGLKTFLEHYGNINNSIKLGFVNDVRLGFLNGIHGAVRSSIKNLEIAKGNKKYESYFISKSEYLDKVNQPEYKNAKSGDVVAANVRQPGGRIRSVADIRTQLSYDRNTPRKTFIKNIAYTDAVVTDQPVENFFFKQAVPGSLVDKTDHARKTAGFGITTTREVLDEAITTEQAARRLPGRIYIQGNSSWEKSDPTKYGAALEYLAIKLQDKFSGVMLLQQDVEKFRGSKVPQSQDFEMAMDIMYGMVRTDLERLEGELERINTTMEESGLTAEMVSDYLYAKHAGERNIYINSKRPEMLDGSGMTTQEAEDIINELETPEMVAVAKLVYDIAANTRKTMVEGGLEKASTIETYEGLYKNYVPLSGLAVDEIDDENNNYPTGGAGMAIYGKTTKAAKGRASKTGVNLIANVIMQNAMVKQRARKDQAMLSLYNLTKNNPNEKVWGVYSAKNPRMKTDETGQQVGMNAFEMKASPNMVPIRINGEQHFIYFKKKDYAQALNGETAERLGFVAKKMSGLLGFMRNSFTQYNPAFFVGNYFRDVHGAIYNVLAEVEREGGIMHGYGINSKKFTKDVIKGSFTTLKALLNESSLGREMSEEMREYLNEWEAAGGRTGFSYSETINNVMENMRSQAETKSGFKKGRQLVFSKPKQFFKYIGAMNESFENSIRLSAYIEARKAGVTKQRAAQLSKNVTINFNKSGELTPALNSMYLFFNASVQGVTRFGRTFQQGETISAPPEKTHEESLEDLPDNPDETPEWKTRISRAQKLSAASVLVSAMQTMVNIALSDRDEDDELVYNKIPEYKKERGFNIMVNGKDYISIPLGYGYNMFNVLGTMLAEVAAGQRDVDDAAMFMAISGHGSFSPIAFGHSKTLGGSIVKGVLPTVLKAPTDAFAFNETYFGSPVTKEQSTYGTEKPASTLSFRSPEVVRQATTALSEMTKGTENIDGTIEFNADPWYYIAQSYWGGAGDFVEESAGMGRAGYEVARKKYNKLAASATNEEFVDNLLSTPKEDKPIIKFSDVPVLKAIYGGPSRFYDFDLFEENKKIVEQYYKEYKAAKDGKVVPGHLDFQGIQDLKKELKKTNDNLKIIWDGRKRVRDIEDFIDRSNATYQLQEAERKEIMEFNKAYYELRGQYVDPKPEGIIPMDKIRKAIGTDE